MQPVAYRKTHPMLAVSKPQKRKSQMRSTLHKCLKLVARRSKRSSNVSRMWKKSRTHNRVLKHHNLKTIIYATKLNFKSLGSFDKVIFEMLYRNSTETMKHRRKGQICISSPIFKTSKGRPWGNLVFKTKCFERMNLMRRNTNPLKTYQLNSFFNTSRVRYNRFASLDKIRDSCTYDLREEMEWEVSIYREPMQIEWWVVWCKKTWKRIESFLFENFFNWSSSIHRKRVEG